MDLKEILSTIWAFSKEIKKKKKNEMWNRHYGKILIEEGTKARRLLGPIEIGAVGTIGMEAIGTIGTTVALDPSGMSMTAWGTSYNSHIS